MSFSRLVTLSLAGCLVAAAAVFGVAKAATTQPARIVPADAPRRLLVGFQDDPSFRWSNSRLALLDEARRANARVVRTVVVWSVAAPRRPANAANPFDPAYRLNDVDQLVREAQLRGIDVLITIWGTPAWANKGAGQNHLPTRLADLQSFSRALAARYSGRYVDYPLVRYWSVWNEPNLEQFLAPQFDAKGRDASPGLYARLYRAAYAGLKAGNRSALVGIGETSPWGRDFAQSGPTQDTHSPGRFAQLLALQRPRLAFDAWAHHPYPTALGLPPTQLAAWPNVTLSALPRFEKQLDTWFGRKNTPLWITEYGYQTRRPAVFGVTAAQQAAYGVQALRLAAADPRVQMFVWFVLRDSVTTPWRSGLLDLAGKRKPAFARFAAAAGKLDASNAVVTAAPGKTQVVLPVEVLNFVARNGAGVPIGVTWHAYLGTKLVAGQQQRLLLGNDGRVLLPVSFARNPGSTYRIVVQAGDVHGAVIEHTLQLVTAPRGGRIAAGVR